MVVKFLLDRRILSALKNCSLMEFLEKKNQWYYTTLKSLILAQRNKSWNFLKLSKMFREVEFNFFVYITKFL